MFWRARLSTSASSSRCTRLYWFCTHAFRRPNVRYGRTPDPETPYQRAAQAWDDRIGSARVQARNWRLAFFGMLALSGGLSAGLVWQSARGHIVPWVVEVDKLGEARAIEPATADYRPTDPQDPQWRYGASR
jgi:type IV secretion system protein TrbF